MQIHVVQSGDTVWQIAQYYDTDVSQVVLLNELENSDVLVVGQSLIIPETDREYVVQPGNTLWQIAGMFGVTVQELAVANNITDPSLIYVGQMLKNPYFPHIVKAGEYIWAIARKYGVRPEQMIAVNDIEEPGLIFPGQTLRIPTAEKPVIEANAYTTRVGEQGAGKVLQLGRHLTYISPFMYSIRTDGELTELSEQPVLQAARANNVAPLLVVTNFAQGELKSDLVTALFRNSEAQEQLITNMLEVIRSKGYAGVNFDFEYVDPEDRENYNDFLRRVVERFHPEGFLVTTALAPKETGGQQGLLYEAQDYQAQGEITDFVIVMTYEWGWAGGEPWAIAPVNKVRDVLDYAVTVIPRDKIVMGVPLYGRDWEIPWEEDTTASSISPYEALQLAAMYGVSIQYDETYQAPFFRYTDENGQEHEVWFEDARSVQAKYDTLKEYDLRGVSYWALGTPFPQNWPILQDNFRVRKF